VDGAINSREFFALLTKVDYFVVADCSPSGPAPRLHLTVHLANPPSPRSVYSKKHVNEQERPVNRRQLLRNSLFGAISATADAREFPANYDESKELAQSGWKPTFLSDHQNQTLIVLSDLIIPETDTPGGKTALVNRFLDLVLAAEAHDTQQSFLNSLAHIDADARSRYGDAFIYLSKESQIELLEFLAYPNSLETWGEGQTGDQTGHNHFQNLKGWITRAFYSSEAGMKALGWNGEVPHGTLTACVSRQG
jgi:hypothetical protein